jgi:membrane fusion protein, heavy metal efflux system
MSSPWMSRVWKFAALASAVLVAAGLYTSRGRWQPAVAGWLRQESDQRPVTASVPGADLAGHDHSHAGHEHGHDHAPGTFLELSPQARLNLGLTSDALQPIQLQDYARSITIPAIVVERPGRTHIEVSAPLTGVVKEVHAVPGAAVEPGALLFVMRLTHEDLVQAQVEFLKTLSARDVERQEIERLRPLIEKGALAATVTREREYSLSKLEALLSAQREALRLHGLSDTQVDGIAEQRRLLTEVHVHAPSPDPASEDEIQLTGQDLRPVYYQEQMEVPPLVVQEVSVHKGQALTAGETMCVLADYRELYIEGAAFEQDAPALIESTQKGWSVEAVFQYPARNADVLGGLHIAYLASEVDVESRTLHFYVELPNEVRHEGTNEAGTRYVTWKYRPGQRLQLRVPVEVWERQIVLPVNAVARDGAESVVFVQNGSHFDRVPVHVRHRDPFAVVIANDGAVFPGDVVARRGAHQMLMALKNQSGTANSHGHSHPH